MTYDKSLLNDIKQLSKPIFVRLPNAYRVKVYFLGSVTLSSQVKLENVLYVPSFKHNLLSVTQFCEQKDVGVLFTKNGCFLQGLFTVRINRKFGECAAGLYMLKDNISIANNSIKFSNIQSSKFSPKCSLKSENVVFKFQSLCVVPEPALTPLLSSFDHMNGKNYVSENSESIKLWHLRLGHMPYNAMKNIAGILVSHEKHRFPCDVCPMARQSKLPFPKSSISSKHCFELLHSDTWGPYKTPTHKGERYFLTIVDDFSRATWTYLLSTKSNAFPLLKSFLAYTERQFSRKVKIIRSDNAYELGSGNVATDFFNSQGIIHQTNCVATPHQNGVVERKHKHFLKVCRALLFQSHLPTKYWGESLLTATHLINLFPSKVLKYKTPYEILLGKTPNYSNLEPFRCLCFASTLSANRDKLAPRAVTGVFLGYPFGKKGYKVLNLQTNQLFVTRHVKFHEMIFIFVHPEPMTNFFPSSSFPSSDIPFPSLYTKSTNTTSHPDVF